MEGNSVTMPEGIEIIESDTSVTITAYGVVLVVPKPPQH